MPEVVGAECTGTEGGGAGGTGCAEGGPSLEPAGGASEVGVAGADVGASLAAGGGAGAGALSTGAGAVGGVVGVSVVTGAGRAKKEDGSSDGETKATDWVEAGVTTEGVSETDGVRIGAGVEAAMLLVRVSMLTVLP